jgi:hypothetical protein
MVQHQVLLHEMLLSEMMKEDYPSMMANQSLCSYSLFDSCSSHSVLFIFREDEFATTASSSSLSNRSIITARFVKKKKNRSLKRIFFLFSEAARRIAASGIPILSRIETEPSISRDLSIRRTTPPLDRVPSRTIRPPPLPPSQPRIPIHQLPRIQRRADASTRVRPRPAPPTLIRTTTDLTSSTNPSFIDNLLNSQERLHNLQNVRMHG